MTKYFIIVFLFLISFDLFSTNRDIQKDLTEKFSLYLKILKNSPEKIRYKNVFYYRPGITIDEIIDGSYVNSTIWVKQNSNPGNEPLTQVQFDYFQNKLTKFNETNLFGIQHLLVLTDFPDAGLKTDFTDKVVTADDVKDLLQDYEAHDDLATFNTFLEDSSNEMIEIWEKATEFTSSERVLTFVSQFSKGNPKEGKKENWFRNFSSGTQLDATKDAFWHYFEHGYVGFPFGTWKFVDAYDKYYSGEVPPTANCGDLSNGLNDQAAIGLVNYYCNTCGFNLNYASTARYLALFIEDFNNTNLDHLTSEQIDKLKFLICAFQNSGSNSLSNYLDQYVGSGLSPERDILLYLGFAAYGIRQNVFDSLGVVALRKNIVITLKNMNESDVVWYGWNSFSRYNVGSMMLNYYNRFDQGECAILMDTLVSVKVDGKSVCVNELWNLSTSFFSGNSQDLSIARVLQKLTMKARGVDLYEPVVDFGTSSVQSRILYWTLGASHISALPNLTEKERVSHNYVFASDYSTFNISATHCVSEVETEVPEPPDEFGVSVGTTYTFSCGNDTTWNLTNLDPFELIYIVNPDRASFVFDGPESENVAISTPFNVAFAMAQNDEAEVKDNIVLGVEVVLAVATFGEAYVLIKSGSVMYKVIGGLMIANQVLSLIDTASLGTNLRAAGLNSGKAALLTGAVSIMKTAAAAGDLASISPSSVRNIVVGGLFYIRSMKLRGLTDANFVRLYDDAVEMAKKSTQDYANEIATEYMAFLGFTRAENLLTKQVDHFIVAMMTKYPTVNFIDKINDAAFDLQKFSDFLAHDGNRLLNDIIANANLTDLPKRIDPDVLLDTWKTLDGHLGSAATKHQSFEILSAASRHLPNLPSGLTQTEYLDIIKNYAGPCVGCVPSGDPIGHMTWINGEDYLNSLVNFVDKYSGVDNYKKVVNGLKNGAPKQQDGAHWVMKYLNDNPTTPVTAFEEKILSNIEDIDIDLPSTGGIYDVLSGTTKIEFKSWQPSFLTQTINKVINNETTSFYPQFLQYLNSGDFKYVFNHGLDKASLTNVKTAFKNLFSSSKAEQIFNTNSNYFITRGIETWQELQAVSLTDDIFDFIK